MNEVEARRRRSARHRGADRADRGGAARRLRLGADLGHVPGAAHRGERRAPGARQGSAARPATAASWAPTSSSRTAARVRAALAGLSLRRSGRHRSRLSRHAAGAHDRVRAGRPPFERRPLVRRLERGPGAGPGDRRRRRQALRRRRPGRARLPRARRPARTSRPAATTSPASGATATGASPPAAGQTSPATSPSPSPSSTNLPAARRRRRAAPRHPSPAGDRHRRRR